MPFDRREFLHNVAGAAVGLGLGAAAARAAEGPRRPMRFGLVTYQWGKDMDLPTLLDVCTRSGVPGVELRTEHAHGVEPTLSQAERDEVRKRFQDSPVELVGYGSNAQFHEDDPAKVKQNIELTKQYVQLMHDCGGSGVKVKPNYVPDDAPEREKTIRQIGRALNVVGAYAADYGQCIRVEVHGRGASQLPVMKAIMDVADHPNVGVCWNCNSQDLEGQGLRHNFDLVKDRLADTVHIREMNVGDYPFPQLMQLLLDANYDGWILLEARTNPNDKVQALREQRQLFEKLTGQG
jgi:sugar phosphate isomerase/epimerase